MDHNKIAARVAGTPANNFVVSLYWLEPEEDSWIIGVTDATDQELREIQKWARVQAGEEWGVTIPSIRLSPGPVSDFQSKISLEDFAAAIRYSTGEEIYEEDCPVFAARGIPRS